MDFTKEELRKIREDLPPSARKTLANKYSLKPGSLRNILSGLSNNPEVILEAFNMAEDHRQKIESVKSKLKKA